MVNNSVICPICGSVSSYNFSSRDLMFNHYERFDYFKCINCHAVFQDPMPTEDQINSFYPEDYSVFDEKSRLRQLSPLKKAILWKTKSYDHLQPSLLFKWISYLASPFYSLDKPSFIKGGVLLDVGCGNGRYLSTMQSLGWSVQGVELSENGLKVCHEAGLNVHHGDLSSAKFADESFDVITVRHVIEHVPDSHTFIAELFRVLKPDGKLLIETPNSEALGRKYLGVKWFANEVPRHLILFSINNLTTLASKHGLKRFSYRYHTSPKIILNSIDYIIENTDKPSNKNKWKRLLARFYIWAARYTQKGDIIHSVFTK
jgi:2-polyprenyl-3-methyl-5-hydroxy-6-metoxy-1,4-benzoquinol methylase